MPRKETYKDIPMAVCKDGRLRTTFTYEGKQYDVKAQSKTELIKKYYEKKAALERGEGKIDKTMTVKAWSALWLKTYIQPKVRQPGQPKDEFSMTEKSYQMYPSKLNNYILPSIGRYKLKDITGAHLQQMLNALAGGSKATVSKVRLVTKAMFHQAYLDRLIVFDPSINLQLPQVTQGQRRPLTDEERIAFNQACERHPQGLWFKLLLATGIRPGEAMALTVGDFDLSKGLLSISKAVESGSHVVSTPKTKAGIRTVPIPFNLIQPLSTFFENRLPNAIAFPQADGISMKTADSVLNEWRSFFRCMEICAGAKTIKKGWRGGFRTIIKDGYEKTACGRIMEMDTDGEDGHSLDQELTIYYLRHTYCTDLQRAGVDMYSAKYLMGHEDISTTAKIYTHGGEDTALAAAKIINQKQAFSSPNMDKSMDNSITALPNACSTAV